ncbi:Fanconi anemia group I protein homolog [Trichoplusia ni]|uniref:Fanconi anemia group I protein homolog n=1 Tax=Trichoplusia ni TaxID=7111 RepID=A0A7E5VA98_TRINI|nr:Fanconi anemia group I protein homolog [Trichoplusia ni]
MDPSKVFNKLKELGHVHSKREELREFCKLKTEQILKFLPRRILNSDGCDVLDCILNGFPENGTAAKVKVKIVEIVLQTMRKENTSLTHCSDVTSRLCLELPRLPVEDLVRWCNDSIQSIVDDSDVNMIWRDVLPECMNAITSQDTIKHCGSELSSTEYKEQCVHTLCQCRWKEGQLVQLAAMFKDMQLSKNDHRQVVNKICSYIIDTPPDTLPPLVHQLLKLCKTYNLDTVLSYLSFYFSTRLYSKLEPPPQDSESTTIDIDDIVPHSSAELSRCLSTCLFHTSRGAADPAQVRRHVRLWPRTQLLRAPFIIDLALAMSDKGADFRSVCLDVIRSAIEQRAMDDLRSRESAWVRSVIPPDVNVVSVLKLITTESANHRQLTVVGLINLAFLLLSVNRLKPVAPTCWSHGKLILVRLCKAQPETAGHILSQLADKLCGDASQKQYADCLYILCKLTPVSVERCSALSSIVEGCQASGADYSAAAAVLDAVHPLLNFSTRTRDTLVMVCRKGLYSRDSQHRCVALSGLLSLLRHVRVSGAPGASHTDQSHSDQFSAHSYLTQLTVDLHATQQGNVVTSRVRNEAMCMEVVSILRRCLVQDALVKQLLYTQIYDCAKDKPSLHESILELLYEHLSKYLPDGDGVATLLFNKCVQMSGAGAILVEPIARLLYSVAQFLQATEEEDLEDILSSQPAESGHAFLKNKLSAIMTKLCGSDSFGNIDMEDPGLSDLTPESKAKCLKVQQILQCYEALIAHQIMQWNQNSTNAANIVHKLFKACNELLEQTKVLPKSSKKGNKTLNETRETVKSQKSQKTQKSQKEKGKAPVKLGNLVKDKAGPFKQLPCLWDLKFCLRIVELLYSEFVPWSSLDQRNHIRGRRDFHIWSLKNVQSVLLGDRLDKKAVATHVVGIAAVIYNRCVCRFQDMCDFDDQTTLSCLEVFKTCLTLMFSPKYSLKMDAVLSTCLVTVTEGRAPTGPECIATILESIHSALLHIEDESVPDERDLIVKKQLAVLIQIATLLLETPIATCPQKTSILVKFEDYIRTSKQDCLSLIGPLLTAFCSEQQEAPLLDELLAKLSCALGRIDEEDTSAGEDTATFPAIEARSGHGVLGALCGALARRGRAAEQLLGRARDLAAASRPAAHSAQLRIEKELTELYKSLVVQLCQLTSWTLSCCKLRCCAGAGSERVLGAAVRLYALLAALARQLQVGLAQTVRFERLLKLSGKKLSTVTDNLITYLEASQQQHNATKVLRETKLIPRLVLEAETFSKQVILLANKGNLNYQQYLSLGTARDFRIKAPVLQEVLNAREQADETREEDVDINDATTEIIPPVDDDNDNEEEIEEDSDEEASRRKRRRVS